MDNVIELFPLTVDTNNIAMWYTPAATSLVSDATVIRFKWCREVKHAYEQLMAMDSNYIMHCYKQSMKHGDEMRTFLRKRHIEQLCPVFNGKRVETEWVLQSNLDDIFGSDDIGF